MKNKLWSILFIVLALIMLCIVGICSVVIDPYFHYHKPLEQLQYPINNQRYQNYGIVENFEYDAIITGTSMTENFLTSEFNHLFNVNSIKVPFSGGSYKEINDLLKKACESNNNIKYIVRGLDGSKVFDSKDSMRYETELYPWYLYDDNIFNDIKYIFNKEVFFEDTIGVLLHTRRGDSTTSFDEYGNWSTEFELGKEAVFETYVRSPKSDNVLKYSNEDYNILKGNISQNVTSLAKEYPDIEFYYFIPPYSIYWWDDCNQKGNLSRQVCAFKNMTELLLEYDNIHIFAFFDDYEMICNPNNYRDSMHYSEDINSKILLWMYEGQHELNIDNYEEYWDKVEEYYSNYEYDSLFE